MGRSEIRWYADFLSQSLVNEGRFPQYVSAVGHSATAQVSQSLVNEGRFPQVPIDGGI